MKESDEPCKNPFITPKPDCIDIGSGVVPLDNIFRYNENCVRFSDKTANAKERYIFDRWFREQICHFGTGVLYQRADENLKNYDPLYGENSDQTFGPEVKMIVYMELNENALTLKQFGIDSDDEITIFIHIEEFYNIHGGTGQARDGGIEPKAGDIFRLEEYGNDRVFPRTGSVYEVTERLDQDVQKINPLLGHYIWMIKGKRFDYSFENNVQPEGGSKQVDEDSIYDPYLQEAETWSTIRPKEIFDYGDYGGGDAVYGDYY